MKKEAETMKLNVFRREQNPAWNRAPEESASGLELSEVKIKKILVAVDFSERSRKALEFALVLARRLEAEIVLLHVFEGVPGELKILEAAYVDTSFRDQAVSNLEEWQREIVEAGITSRTVMRDAAAVDHAIEDAAKSSEADLIIVGRHERKGRALTSNIVFRILGRAPCPVLVV